MRVYVVSAFTCMQYNELQENYQGGRKEDEGQWERMSGVVGRENVKCGKRCTWYYLTNPEHCRALTIGTGTIPPSSKMMYR